MDNPIDPATFTGLDMALVAVVLISAVLAYFRGRVHEVLSVAGWIGAISATIYGFPYLRPLARQWTEIEIVADFGAGIVLFGVSLIILSIITR